MTVRLEGADTAGALEVEANPPSMTVQPGHAQFAEVRVRSVERFWRGPEVTHPFTVTVLTDETTQVQLDGTYVQEPLLPSS